MVIVVPSFQVGWGRGRQNKAKGERGRDGEKYTKEKERKRETREKREKEDDNVRYPVPHQPINMPIPREFLGRAGFCYRGFVLGEATLYVYSVLH